ncbi:3D-(3,5/4)-trihydroxycyclohexane-1,2-dione acylhydrolase (decyclizing) [Rhizobium redzepovicii]|uniref:3D-(3,5/4)-trihydroxycyclohexane-1,2-dione acylhydrolase (decyclizing) n=1 Tax=Rhizobium redzepovicii TaxID=2867518 RepID=UPI001C9318CF|nr:3D-(3,5/4)-trihydroxycyclohexane-1,2-dione acylhydrolase (decyclizing) [Rhizobium redzepovicii]MBY4592595.1 3D-(3,5/4)-trihydroxycyclohexane-1,2-dione acylhydrolase (decyclizing) [Rhizobium redzepovicii]MBY4615411.1 3D-(3,5/4)-trihydroxycyclohexane-1,2-dione acylhydrolase (decyclizing) [Rhizobium redzepovicii]
MSNTIRLTAAQATIQYLQKQYSVFDGDRERLIGGIFGIFGHGNVASISQAIEEYGADLPYYQPKNEQAMVHSAMGYAKMKNRRATLACTASIGPGSTNMITGAATATVNRIPVLLFASDTFAHRRTGNVLQELEHPVDGDLTVNDCFRPISRFFDRISRPEQILTALPEAMRVLTDPADTGAVTISFPQDVEGEAYDYPLEFFRERNWVIRRRDPSQEDVGEAIAVLSKAKAPLIIAGGGVRYSAAERALRDFADEFGIPVAETHAGKGVSLDTPLCLGGMGVTGTGAAGRIAERADVVVAIGTRLQDFQTGSRSAFHDPNVTFVSINTNSYDAHKLRGVQVVGDARLSIERIATGLRAAGYATASAYREEIRSRQAEWKEAYRNDIAVPPGGELNYGTITQILNEATRAGDVVIAAAGTPPGEIHKGWDNSNGSKAFLEFGFSTMGHEIPAAIGARLANRSDDEIFVLIGDGTYLMGPTEIVTAVQENARITVVVVENYGYQCIRDLQENSTGIDNLGNEFRARDNDVLRPNGSYLEVDYAANARSMGASVLSAADEEQFRQALAKARPVRGPVVIVVKAEKRGRSIGSGVWWDVGAAEVTNTSSVSDATAKFRAGEGNQRYLG